MELKKLILPPLIFLVVSCVSYEEEFQLITVNGSIFSSDAGVTLVHEHVMVDWIGANSTGYHRWDRAEVVERVLPYFIEVREKGVQTIFECTPAYLGRDPFILQELSRSSGIQIVTNTGYYGAVDNQFIPAHAYEESAEEIAARWIDEFVYGIDGSEIRPGFMKISVGSESQLSELHQKIVKAAALTHLETGMSIKSHTIGDVPAFEIIELLKDEGVSPSALIWTHAQSGSVEAIIKAAKEGAWISLDSVIYNPSLTPGEPNSLEWFAERLITLKNEELLQRVLISHDAGWYDVGEPEGGDFRGYTDIFDHFLPLLSEMDFTEDEIQQLLVQNPQKALSIQIRSDL